MSETMRVIKFTVDGKAQSWLRTGGRGAQRFTPTAMKDYANLCRILFNQAKPRGWLPWEGPVYLKVRAYFPIPKSWPRWKRERAATFEPPAMVSNDWDNLGKLPSDALEHLAYGNDRQVTTGHVDKVYSLHPRVSIKLEFLSDVLAKRFVGCF